jgi:hypothetical protein
MRPVLAGSQDGSPGCQNIREGWCFQVDDPVFHQAGKSILKTD